MSSRCSALIAAVMLGALPSATFAADPTGTWSTEGGKATVRIASCGTELCGTIVALKEPNDPATGRPKTDVNNPDPNKRNRPMIGVVIVFGMKPSGTADKWNGQVYNAEDGKTYTGSLTMQGARALKLEGCVLGGLICKGQVWSRAS
jgi:uncharacterized protein (DUF2147 family)